MGSDFTTTDERLRQWLNSNQPARELMCVALLGLDKRYSAVRPRRPYGGPDSSRDIEAVLDGATPVWGAVGFQNSVNDSTQEKTRAKKKFDEDVRAALDKQPKLKAFVFFTNVDLTPAERDELQQLAAGLGITHTDIYYRVRLRIALDSPQGLATRYQYLQIPLSDAEQATFFATYGSDLQEMLTRQHQRVDEQFQRIEFLHWMARPIFDLSLIVELNKRYEAEELGYVRALAKLFLTPETDKGWYIEGSTDFLPAHGQGKRPISTQTFASFSDDKQPKLERVHQSTRAFSSDLSRLHFGLGLKTGFSTPTPELSNGYCYRFYFSENLVGKVSQISLNINGYSFVRFGLPKAEAVKLTIPWSDQDATNPDLQWVHPSVPLIGWIDLVDRPTPPKAEI